MLPHYRAVREAGRLIAGAADRVVEALRQGRVEQEPAMTDRLLGAIEESLQGKTTHGIIWEAKTLTDRGRGAQETEFGADFMGVVNIDLPDYQVAKGFLAQAKLARDARSIDRADLRRQCGKMLDHSPASYVFVYSPDGIRVVPAIAVIASKVGLDELYARSVGRFFEEHFECFIGDQAIVAATPDTLDSLRERFDARRVILLRAHSTATVAT
jgi:hypothetical protein